MIGSPEIVYKVHLVEFLYCKAKQKLQWNVIKPRPGVIKIMVGTAPQEINSAHHTVCPNLERGDKTNSVQIIK